MSSTTGVDKDDSKPDDDLMCDNDSEQVNINEYMTVTVNRA